MSVNCGAAAVMRRGVKSDKQKWGGPPSARLSRPTTIILARCWRSKRGRQPLDQPIVRDQSGHKYQKKISLSIEIGIRSDTD